MLPEWPTTLPKPSTDSYQIKVGSNIVRTMLPRGNSKQRRVAKMPLDEFSIIWDMTPNEFGTFENFFINDLYEGTSWFEMFHHTGTGWTESSFRFSSSSSPYVASNVGSTDFKVSATLERRMKKVITSAQYSGNYVSGT